MIKFGGDLDDMNNPADPFGLRGEIEQALYEQTAGAVQQMGGCGQAYTAADGSRQLCLVDWDKCTLHNPVARAKQATREVKLFDRYVGVVKQWLSKAKG